MIETFRCKLCNDILDESSIDNICVDCYATAVMEDIDIFIDDDYPFIDGEFND